MLDAKIPEGPLADKWNRRKNELKLVNPANKRKYEVIVVGTGLAGASAAASLSEMGYKVKSFCIQDSPRRAHSIAAQGGINAAKNYQNDGDSVYRLFYDTIKGGDYRSREANVHRLAEVSVNIIDQCVAQGVPFARDYGGYLDNRSFGGAQVSRTFYARGQTGQQLLLGAYSALMKETARGNVQIFPRREMLDLVVADNRAVGIVCRNLVTGQIERHGADAVVLATGGYGNVFDLSTNARACNVTACWRAYKRGAFFANPCYTQIHPTCIPVHGDYQSKLTLMSESLRNDGRIWVPKKKDDTRAPNEIPEDERNYYLEEKYPSFGNLVPRDVASRNAKEWCDHGYGVGGTKQAVYLDFHDAIQREGADVIKARYGNLFDMYERIVDQDPYNVPMMIYPAVHYTMGGLWVDYHLMSNLPGLFVLGEANFSDHGANRLGASALMQGLADGYFVIPYTIGDYLAQAGVSQADEQHAAFNTVEAEVKERLDKLVNSKGKKTVAQFHRELGLLLWNDCGMARNAEGLQDALEKIPAIREEFWENVTVTGSQGTFNQVLERAGRVADFLEFGELMCLDALDRSESCGGHFREESQTEEGEAQRRDDEFCHVSAWEHTGIGQKPALHKESLVFENVELTQRELQVMSGKTISLTLKVWRQEGPDAPGHLETHEAKDISTDMSFLEMIDVVNEGLQLEGKEPIAFDHDCREGICGACGCAINGAAHGPRSATTLCQLHMRQFEDGQTLVVEPFRSRAFPIVKDLVVDRSALDRIIQAGGYVSTRTGQAPEAHAVPVPKKKAEAAMDAAACIGCGACVAACPNSSASLFTAAKITQFSQLPQGHPERERRVVAMVQQMDKEGFGSCSKHYECEAVCPKEIKVENITRMNAEYIRALAKGNT